MRLRSRLVAWVTCVGFACAAPAHAQSVEAACIQGQPALLKVDLYADVSLPMEDPWQVIWNQVPISDAQLAWLADDEALLTQIRDGMDTRGPWVFAGMVTAATGTALSSAGWALLGGAGDNRLSNGVTLSMALGGMVLAVAGLLVVADSMQSPLSPFMTPTPKHRLTRNRAEELVLRVNQRFAQRACGGMAPLPPPAVPLLPPPGG